MALARQNGRTGTTDLERLQLLPVCQDALRSDGPFDGLAVVGIGLRVNREQFQAGRDGLEDLLGGDESGHVLSSLSVRRNSLPSSYR
jgi:hypothetical protein